jgi:hypothetical protein
MIVKQNTIYLIISLLLILIFSACQEVYINSDLDAGEKIPVIEGKFTNSSSPHTVKLYYARPYNESKEEYIKGARVTIFDNLGNSVELSEENDGFYMSERNDLTGVIGRIYTLRVELPDGNIYQSYPQVMPDTIGIEKCSFNFDSETSYTRDESGKVIESTEPGVGYYMTIANTQSIEAYFRLSSDFYVYSKYNETLEYKADVSDSIVDSIFRFTIQQTLYYDCYELFNSQNLPIIGKLSGSNLLDGSYRKYTTQFFKKDYNFYTTHNFVEYIVYADIYSLTKASYDYYESVNKQLNAPDRIYDPIPNQLTGNIYMVSDSTQKVLGIFEVSSRCRRVNAIYKYISFGAESLQSRYYPDTTTYNMGCFLVGTFYDTVTVEKIGN